MIVYRGKYPTRINSIGGSSKGVRIAVTNEGGVYEVKPINGFGPKLGSDILDWPKREFLHQSSVRRCVD